jgi:hypothetical protein
VPHRYVLGQRSGGEAGHGRGTSLFSLPHVAPSTATSRAVACSASGGCAAGSGTPSLLVLLQLSQRSAFVFVRGRRGLPTAPPSVLLCRDELYLWYVFHLPELRGRHVLRPGLQRSSVQVVFPASVSLNQRRVFHRRGQHGGTVGGVRQ